MERIRIAEPSLTEEDVSYVVEALRSGWVSGRGAYVQGFEEAFARWLGVDHAISTTSGTTALHLALATLGIEKQDEVIIPAFSMGAIPFAVCYLGAKPVLVDSEWNTWNMDPGKIAEKITPKTRAIIVMHTYGHPADMGPILEVAREHDLYLVEDAAEAHGAEYRGKKAGTFGDISCFSFFANKIITTGEGGMVVTNNADFAEKARVLKDMAFERDPSRKFLHKYIGFNYRLTNIQAALGSSQMNRIEKFIEIRRRNAMLYNSLLKTIEGVILPPEAPWARNVFWMYSILIDEKAYGTTVEGLMKTLQEEYDVETRPFFVPIHQQPVYVGCYSGQTYPIAEKLSAMGMNLPSGNTLTENQVRYVGDAIREARR